MRADPEPDACPLIGTDEKLDEAHFFLHQVLEAYHDPDPFRYKLNAFLQALRSVTLFLQREGASIPSFAVWYEERLAEMSGDPLLRRFLQGRNLVVHQRPLVAESTVLAGMYRDGRLKLGMELPISPEMPSGQALAIARRVGLVDEDHAFIGEQAGIRRTWRYPELGAEDEIASLCHIAWARVHQVVAAAHSLVGRAMQDVPEDPRVHDVSKYDLLLETDLDPSLPDQWGWN